MGTNAWETLVSQLGIEGARAEMRRRRSLVKNHPGGAFRLSKEFAKQASQLSVEARKKKTTK